MGLICLRENKLAKQSGHRFLLCRRYETFGYGCIFSMLNFKIIPCYTCFHDTARLSHAHQWVSVDLIVTKVILWSYPLLVRSVLILLITNRAKVFSQSFYTCTYSYSYTVTVITATRGISITSYQVSRHHVNDVIGNSTEQWLWATHWLVTVTVIVTVTD